MFTLHIQTENAAFDGDPTPEIARILRALADGIDTTGDTRGEWSLRDVNGNTVGRATLTPDD